MTPSSLRLEFAETAARGLYTMTELCARYGISRRVGYKWLARYQATGADGLTDQSRRPLGSPRAVSDEVAARLLACRQQHPTWGPRKLLAYLARRRPRVAWPAASTVGELLKRHGLVRPRRRRPQPGHPGRPTTPMDAPNAVWTADFKGQFRTGDGAYCYPLTVCDGYSRYLLACRGLPSVETVGARGVFERLFRTYGLPARIRSDNGVPFATSALGRLSQLSAWWIKLGITPELIEPSSPQQNGRHERMHRTLKAEATKPARASLSAQQRRFDAFRAEYNAERPHEALGNDTPADHYVPSTCPYPARLADPAYPGHFEVRYVSGNGGVRWHNQWVNVSHVLAEEYVGLEEVDDGVWSVYFGPVLLGRFDERDLRIHGAHNRNKLHHRS
jgi:transposase InsO family protein